MSDLNKFHSFYYTFGTSEHFPYQKGWVKVNAANRQEADTLFRKHHPDRTEGILNCAFVYDQAEFEAMRTRSPMPPDWSVCHEVLSPDLTHSSHWAEIRNDYFSVDHTPEQDGALRASITIDAWMTHNDEEEGKVIASVLLSEHGDILVNYHDNIARWDELAQENIKDAISQLQEHARECNIQRPEPQNDFSSEVASERPAPIRTGFADQIQNAQIRAGTGVSSQSIEEAPEH